jgi:hypothetical protein
MVLLNPVQEGVPISVSGMVPFVNNDYFIKQQDNEIQVCPCGFINNVYDFVGESHIFVSKMAIQGSKNVIDVDFEVLDKELGRSSNESKFEVLDKELGRPI